MCRAGRSSPRLVGHDSALPGPLGRPTGSSSSTSTKWGSKEWRRPRGGEQSSTARSWPHRQKRSYLRRGTVSGVDGAAMRRFEESQQSDYERSVRIGRDNADCIEKMHGWCEHFRITRTSFGLYAEMSGLPIASHKIGCPFVQGESESMNVRWLVSDFLVQHCDGCPHHSPAGDHSWGLTVIESRNESKRKAEEAQKEQESRVRRLREQLRDHSKDIGDEADAQSKSVIEFLEGMFSEDEAERAKSAQLLRQSAELAPELFPVPAIELLLELTESEGFSEVALSCCRESARGRQDLRPELKRTALSCIETGRSPEKAAAVLLALGDAIDYPLQPSHIERLLLFQDHSRPIGGWGDGPPAYPNATLVLTRCVDADMDAVQTVIRRYLVHEGESVRSHLSGAIQLLQKQRPEVVLTVLADVLVSLEIPDESRFEGASGRVANLLKSAFRNDCERVDGFLAGAMHRVRTAVQEDVIKVYRSVFLDRSDRRSEQKKRTREEVSIVEKTAVSRLLVWMKDETLEVDIRAEIVEALEVACSHAPAVLLPHFDSLLGYFAIVCDQDDPPKPPARIVLPNEEPENPVAKNLANVHRSQHWGFFKQRLRSCLKELCTDRRADVVEVVSRCFDQSSGQTAERLRASMASLLGEIGKDYRLRPLVLPFLMRALMDYESAIVRCEAIDSVVEMYRYSQGKPPTNLIDVLIVHLQDPTIIVHQAAVKAVEWHSRWFDSNRAIEVLLCLSVHMKVYGKEPFRLEEVCRAVLNVGRQDQRLKAVCFKMVDSVFPTGEELADAKIADELTHFATAREDVSPAVATALGTFLGKYDRDRYNSYNHSRRGGLFTWLHELSNANFQRCEEALLDAAIQLASRDPWEACHFASLFSRYGRHKSESEVLSAASSSLPREARHQAFREDLDKLAASASVNARLQAGERSAAEDAVNSLGDGRQ